MSILAHPECFEGIEVACFFVALELALNGTWGWVGVRRLPRQNKRRGLRDLVPKNEYFF